MEFTEREKELLIEYALKQIKLDHRFFAATYTYEQYVKLLLARMDAKQTGKGAD